MPSWIFQESLKKTLVLEDEEKAATNVTAY